MNVGLLLRQSREGADLSIRALAELAHTPASTVTRIEKGVMDPTVGMLQRLLKAAGQQLDITTRPDPRARAPQIGGLVDAWSPSRLGDQPDWTRLRSFLDRLALHSEEVAFAIRRAPRSSGSPLMDALLAGMADKLADDQHLARPYWTSASTRRLDVLWESPGTPRMRARARKATPTQLRDHGLSISADSLWRDLSAAHA